MVTKHLQDPSKVKIFDVTKSDEAALLAAKNNIFSVPTVIKKTPDRIIKCDLRLEDNKVKANCEGKEALL